MATLDVAVEITVTTPSGVEYTCCDRASVAGYIDSAGKTFTVTEPGVDTVHVSATQDRPVPPTGLAPDPPLIADGRTLLDSYGDAAPLSAILGSVDSTYHFFVAEPREGLAVETALDVSGGGRRLERVVVMLGADGFPHVVLGADEIADLAAFLGFGTFEPGPERLPDGPLSPIAEGGRQVFKAAGCGACHSGDAFTDGRLHDVGTGIDPRETRGSEYDTPSLLGIYDTAPYLHDGSAATLTTHNAGDKHGVTSTLTDGQIDALVAYLRSLP